MAGFAEAINKVPLEGQSDISQEDVFTREQESARNQS